MSNRRPKKTTLVTPVQAGRLRRKWRKWIDAIARDVGQQLLNYETFEDLREVVNSNPRTRNPVDFTYWTTSNYAAATAMAIRRFDDIDSRSQSLGRILYEMLQYPGVITRRSHTALYRESLFMAESTFDNIAGPGRDVLGSAVIRSDLCRLEKACARARRFVNKKVAHSAGQGSIRKVPTFDDFNDSLIEIERICKRYIVLLTAVYEESLKPKRSYDWMAVFSHPWLDVDKKP